MTLPGQERLYRRLSGAAGLTGFIVAVKETDLFILAETDLTDPARAEILTQRRFIEDRIAAQPEFLSSLEPLPDDPLAPPIIRDMLRAGLAASTGPMAAVAGAMAHRVGLALGRRSAEVIVENGGDLYLDTDRDLTVSLLAVPSPLSGRFGLKVPASAQPLGVSSSSGTVGHSLSLGRADLATVAADSPAGADALATALGNRVGDGGDVESALDWLADRAGARGGVVIIGRHMGAWGELELTELNSGNR